MKGIITSITGVFVQRNESSSDAQVVAGVKVGRSDVHWYEGGYPNPWSHYVVGDL